MLIDITVKRLDNKWEVSSVYTKSFRKSGHFPSLLSAFLYFDVSFMVWVMCGALSLYITKDFNLTDVQKATMVAIPTLGGSIFRIPMGLLADRIGLRKAGIIGMVLTILPLVWAWKVGTSLNQVYTFGILLGIQEQALQFHFH